MNDVRKLFLALSFSCLFCSCIYSSEPVGVIPSPKRVTRCTSEAMSLREGGAPVLNEECHCPKARATTPQQAEGPRVNTLFCDLALVDEIDRCHGEVLPLFYNQSLVGGYFLTPSARMSPLGVAALGGGVIPPYNVYGGVIQLFDRIELSGIYRTFKGGIEALLSDDSERFVNAKIALIRPCDGFSWFPTLSVGGDIVVSSASKNSQYVIATKSFLDANFELSLGWGRKRLKGFFGGAQWTPLRKTRVPILKDLTFLAEYDPTDYHRDFGVESKERRVRSRWNVGLGFLGWNILQVSAMSVRGKEIAALASLRYPIGTAEGLFPKVNDPKCFQDPPYYGEVCEEIKQLAEDIKRQGLFLNAAKLYYDCDMKKGLWLKLINYRYREVEVVRERLLYLLAARVPQDVNTVTVVLEADGIPAYSYRFRREDLVRFQEQRCDVYELELLSEMREPCAPPAADSLLLYHKKKRLGSFMARPRSLSYFQGDEGKYKYSLGVLAAVDGYILDTAYYRLQASYAFDSSKPFSKGSKRALTPRRLPEVRTDALRYHEQSTASIEEAYLQKGWYLKEGWSARLSGGYFEPAYMGSNVEFLYFPVGSDWAFGVEGAVVWKRSYQGLGLDHSVRRIKHGVVKHESFLGKQAFFNIHYYYKPLCLDFLLKTGTFLARDVGSRIEMTRTFKSGFQFSLWYTLSTKYGDFFHDRGFAFSIPLDFFLKRSSRSTVGYGVAATLRNNGAISATGKSLYLSLSEERR